ncbi:MAG: hypothetical protein KIS92_21405 [Planctomycetota bacterium]|nr:hypothetical protein [Planctomycetota bacterium]
MASAWPESTDAGISTLPCDDELLKVVRNLEEICDDLGRLEVGGALIHKLNNARARLLAQSRRIEVYAVSKKEWRSDAPEESAAQDAQA